MTVFKFFKCAAIVPLAIFLTSCGKQKVDVNKYLEVNFIGFDTVGTASYNIDIEKLVQDNPKAFNLTDKSSEEEIFETVCEIEGILDGQIDKTSDLSNGDTVTFKWDFDNEKLEEKYPVILSHDDKKTEVKELDQTEKFDPFDYITVTYEGTAPNASVKISTESNKKVSGIIFTADKTAGLSNDDKIKVTADIIGDDINAYCAKTGRMPSCTEKEYTVEGLSRYALKLSDIPEESIKKIDDFTQDGIRAKAAATWNEPESLKKITFLGNYMIYPKNSINTFVNNYLYMIYKIDVENSKTAFSYYYYSYVDNVMILPDGTCSFDLNRLKTPLSFGESFQNQQDLLGYEGYMDLDSLFNNHVTAKTDKFEYKSSVKN